MTDRTVGLFRLIDPPPGAADAVADLLGRCSYPWARILPALRERRKDAVPVVFEDRDGAGSYWPNVAIVVDPDTPARMAEVFAYECAHLVDHLTLEADDRDVLHAAMHPDGVTCGRAWHHGDHHEQAREAFMYAWVRAFVPGLATRSVYGPHTIPAPDTVRAATLRRTIVAYKDVPEGHTHRDAIEALAAVGIVGGHPDGTFRPSEPVTRAQVATMVAKALDVAAPGWRPSDG